MRAALIKHRTALVNQWRGLLAEYGIVLPVGIGAFFRAAPRVIEDAEHPLSDLMRRGCCIDSLKGCTLWKKRLV